ncbi:MAG: ATP synthase F1 subunit epsilon [Saprospiraceae bacterium]|jgi:F-type H+-transporting ATPase subunit epsilon|nr:ATP synthase F1 subunit epsilon [Saprospiraceae bacterium]
MQLSVLTPDQEYFSGEITSVKVPGVLGEFQVLNNHAPIVSALSEGKVQVKTADGKVLQFSISGGFIEILNNNVSLLVQNIEE